MKSTSFSFIALVAISIFANLISAETANGVTYEDRIDNRQDNRVGRRGTRQERRKGFWQTMKDWFKVGHERRVDRREDRKITREYRRAERKDRREGRGLHRKERRDGRHERRDDFFGDEEW